MTNLAAVVGFRLNLLAVGTAEECSDSGAGCLALEAADLVG